MNSRPFITYFTLVLLFFFTLLQSCSPSREGEDDKANLPLPDPDNGGIQLAEDFGAMVVIDSLGRGRHIVVNDNGDIYVNLRRLRDSMGVAALRDTSGDGRADLIEGFGGTNGTGIDIHGGYIYYSSRQHVFRQKLRPGQLLPDTQVDTLIEFPEGTKAGHSSKAFTFDGQGNIYVNVGSRSNACQEEWRTKGSPGQDPCPELPNRAGIWQFQLGNTNQQQSDGQLYATGIRNTVGLDWNFSNNKLYAVQHGRDDLWRFWPETYSDKQSRELPAEEFLLLEKGDDFGWPYCYYDQFQGKKLLCPEYGGDGKTQGRCEGIKQPLLAFPGHWAPNDLLFYTGDQFPERYKNGAFIAFHGSWNRLNFAQAGFLVAFVPMEDGTPSGSYEIFAGNFIGKDSISNPGHAEFRPTGLAQGPDGSLYISDSRKGRIWRVMYYGEGSGISGNSQELAGGEETAGAESEEGAALAENLAAGQIGYNAYCRACHMDDGKGVSGMNPPLNGTEWVNGDKTRLINVVLNGLSDPIEINGETFQNAMASHSFLSDKQIADVLSFVRNSFGNEAGPVTEAEVKAVRE